MRTAVATGLVAVALGLAGCADERPNSPGPTVERNYPVGSFDQIELAGSYNATVRTGTAPSVHAKGGENVLDRLVVEVEGGKLRIHPKQHLGFHWGWGKASRVELTITVPQLHSATLAGSGGMNIDRVDGESFEGTVAGSGGLTLASTNVQSLKLSIAGSGSVKAGTGKAVNAEYNIVGAGDVDAASVAAQQLKVSIGGSGGVKAHASATADISIMGAGDVDVAGGAKCSVSKAGSGNVRCS